MADTEETKPIHPLGAVLPRITIQFCTQCKWMLRAAYVSEPSLPWLASYRYSHVRQYSHRLQYAQELLSTFSLAIGEVALQPSTGGTFIVTIHHGAPAASSVLWDRKVDGGFPETKELKRRVRDVIEPGRNLGHVDRDHAKPAAQEEQQKQEGSEAGVKDAVEGQASCEDCR